MISFLLYCNYEYRRRKVILDEDILKVSSSQELKEQFTQVTSIGKIKELPAGSKDEKIGAYCYEHGCDLIIADKRAYDKFFRDARIKSVIISNYGIFKEGKRLIYRIQIIN